jgi:hypothetical protein
LLGFQAPITYLHSGKNQNTLGDGKKMNGPLPVTPADSQRSLACPHCTVTFRSEVLFSYIAAEDAKYWVIEAQLCPACAKVILYLVNTAVFNRYAPAGPYQEANVISRELVRPRATSRKPLSPEVPEQYREDYLEACLVLPDSAKASAALSRRCLQLLLREAGNTKKRDLADQIAEVLQDNRLPSDIASIVDAVRNIGNFAAHPIKSTSTGEIVPVEPGEAELNLEVLESLFDFYFVRPAETRRRVDALNQKLKDAGKPEIKRPPTTI